MWPIGGILDSINRDLLLTNVTATDDVFAEQSPQFASASCYIAIDGDVDRTVFGNRQLHAVNQWINDEFAGDPSFDASAYETGYFNVTGSTAYLSGNSRDTYHTLSSEIRWTLSKNLGPGFDGETVTGELRVREIANPSNEVTATLTITITSGL